MDTAERDKCTAALLEAAKAELAQNGVLDRLSPEWKQKLSSGDETEAGKALLAACRAAGRQLLVNETQLPRTDGSVARLAEVDADPRFVNCLALALCESAEKLVASGITKYRRVAFYIRAISGNAELSPAVRTIDGLFERIDFELLGRSAPEKKPGFLTRILAKFRAK